MMKPVSIDLFLDRFLKYVTFNTQSSENSKTYPSTKDQLKLGRYLTEELKSLNLEQIEITPYGYVFATLASNVEYHVPTIGLIAHIDTSPEVSGAGVRPVIHKNYQGGDVVLTNGQVIHDIDNPDLKKCIGHDIITSDGNTLLGADNKAGIAEIMATLQYLKDNPDVMHGKIRIAFTVDEEIGKGTEYFNLEKFDADFAYTIDGSSLGDIEVETFCADTVIAKIKGINIHPGYAKNRLVNSIKIAAEFIRRLPEDTMSPETTEKKEGYLHPHYLNGSVEYSELTFIVRDFYEKGLKEKEKFLREIQQSLQNKYPAASFDIEIKESYRNMKAVLDKFPEVTNYAMESARSAGIEPKLSYVRGGTDGARLSFMGLPTPNIFTGGHNFHSKKEWISVQDMAKTVETLVYLCRIYAEKKK